MNIATLKIVTWYNTVFENVRSMGLLMGVEGYKNRYNVNVAANVDLIVTFRDDIAAFKSNFGSQGPGVHCTNNKSYFKISRSIFINGAII